jgi:hypothetical protein
MALMGDMPLNDGMPYHEEMSIATSSPVLGNSTAPDIEVGRYTMPFDGWLTFRLEWTMWFNNYQQIQLFNVGFTTPTPTYALQMDCLDGTSTTYVVARNQMGWSSLAKNTLVVVNLRFNVGGGGSNVTGDQRAVTFRSVREGLLAAPPG